MRLTSLSFVSVFLWASQSNAQPTNHALCYAGQPPAGVAALDSDQMQTIRSALQAFLGAQNFIKLAYHCGHDTDEHARLILETIDAVGCSSGTPMNDTAKAMANNDGNTNYRIAVFFDGATTNDSAAVEELCFSIAEVDPASVDFSTLSSAALFSEEVTALYARLRKIWAKSPSAE